MHVDQFIGNYGSEFKDPKQYAQAVVQWIASYGVEAIDAYMNNRNKNKDQLHDQIPTEVEANQKEAVLYEFLKTNDFIRKRKTKNGVKEIVDNRVINLLKALSRRRNEGRQRAKVSCAVRNKIKRTTGQQCKKVLLVFLCFLL